MDDEQLPTDTPGAPVIDYYARERELSDSHKAERDERERHAQRTAMRRAWRKVEWVVVGIALVIGVAYLAYRLLPSRASAMCWA